MAGAQSLAASLPPFPPPGRTWAVAVLAALLSGSGLLAFYLALVSWAQGWGHAWALLGEDLWFVGPVTLGFGLQAGMFVYLKKLHAGSGAGAAIGGGSGGISGGAMLACCAHHVSDIAPFLGVSGAAIFLNQVKEPLAFVAIVSNVLGVIYIAMRIRSAWHPQERTMSPAKQREAMKPGMAADE